jgi:hypothetical protein
MQGSVPTARLAPQRAARPVRLRPAACAGRLH